MKTFVFLLGVVLLLLAATVPATAQNNTNATTTTDDDIPSYAARGPLNALEQKHLREHIMGLYDAQNNLKKELVNNTSLEELTILMAVEDKTALTEEEYIALTDRLAILLSDDEFFTLWEAGEVSKGITQLFKNMVKAGNIPNNVTALLSSSSLPAT
jgi:hypothetical protein